MPHAGLIAADEAGIDLARLALIPDTGVQLVAVLSALLVGVDLIAVAFSRDSRSVA